MAVPRRPISKTHRPRPKSANKIHIGKSINCMYFTEKYAQSFWGKYFHLYQERGEPQLTTAALQFSNKDFLLDIPFSSILKIETRRFSRIAKPISLGYLAITFQDGDATTTIGLLPGRISSPIWQMNSQTMSLFNQLRRHSNVSGKVTKVSVIPTRSETMKQVTIFLALLGIAMLIGAISQFR
jgi:hypothetical protein